MLTGNLASVPYPTASCSPWHCSELPRRTTLHPRDPPSAGFLLPARLRKAERIAAHRKRIRTPVDGLRSHHRPPAPAWRIAPPVRSAGIEPFSDCLSLQPRLQRLIWTERCNRQVLVGEPRFDVPSRHDHRVAPACCKRQLLPVAVPMASRPSRARSPQALPHAARRSGESSRTRPDRALTTVLAACVDGQPMDRIWNCGVSLGSVRAAGPRQPAQPTDRQSASAGYQHPALHAQTPRGGDPRGLASDVDPYPCTGRRAAGARRHDRLGSCDHINERARWAWLDARKWTGEVQRQ